jgi:hypothetical protein
VKPKDDDDNWAGEGFSKPYEEKWASPEEIAKDDPDEDWAWK